MIPSTDTIEQGCLAGAIRADDRQQLQFAKRQVNPGQGFDPPEGNVNVFNLKHCHLALTTQALFRVGYRCHGFPHLPDA